MSEEITYNKEFSIQGLKYTFLDPINWDFSIKGDELINELNLFIKKFVSNYQFQFESKMKEIDKFLKNLSPDILATLPEIKKEEITPENITSIKDNILNKIGVSDELLYDIGMVAESLNEAKGIAAQTFWSNPFNRNKLFKTCLNEDVSKINFNPEGEDGIIEFDDFFDEVLNSFFLSRKFLIRKY